jgi:DNA-binding transcriptional regulator YiaG
MYQVDHVLDEQEVREALIQSRRESRQIQLPNIAERLDSTVAKVKVWLAGTPKPSQQCC